MSRLQSLRLDLQRPFFASGPAIPLLSGRWLGAAIAGAVLIDILLLLSAGLRIAISWASIAFVSWAIAAAILCYVLRAPATRSQRFVRELVESVSLFAVITIAGVVASYPLAMGTHAFVDPALERIDLILHFHWLSWYEVVAGNPWIQRVERAAYLSIFVTPAIILGYFAWSEQRAQSRLFIATFWVAAVITLALFPLLPAIGPFASLWHGNMPYMPLSALYQDEVIRALRHHAIQAVDLGALHGLVCAPSFHAASAVLYIATAWRIAPLRWPLTALNVAMLLATPVEGTHYLADLLSGIAVALLALGLTPILVRLTHARSDRRDGVQAAVSIAAE